MNTLLDLDPDSATDNLALLSHMHPHCGFQYKNSYTYWSASSIVGKVLAPTCHAVGGWIGPARPTTDLEPTQIARIRSRKPKQRMTPEDVESMAERSDPLGPAAETYPVDDYQPVTPTSGPEDAVDTVRVELLSLKPAERPEDSPPQRFRNGLTQQYNSPLMECHGHSSSCTMSHSWRRGHVPKDHIHSSSTMSINQFVLITSLGSETGEICMEVRNCIVCDQALDQA